MKLQNNTPLTPAQRHATNGILGGLSAGDVIVLRSAAGMGRSTVLRSVHEAAGGALLGAREFMRSLAAREPAAIEEAFLYMVEQALAAHQLVIVDDLHLVANPANSFKNPRAYLLDAALTGLMGEAVAWRKKLVFGVENEAPWPVQRRAYQWEIGPFGVEDFECICRSLLPAQIADRLDYAQIHRFAPALSAQRLANACQRLSGAANPGSSRLSGGFFPLRRAGSRENRSFLTGDSPAKS
jgi:hypothetical protein